jgi:hypothetical protein
MTGCQDDRMRIVIREVTGWRDGRMVGRIDDRVAGW